jgi:hypothetical protein
MLEFLQANYPSIIVVVLVVAALLVLYKLGKKDTVKKIVLYLVVQAEKALGSKTGELKYAMVINAIYDRLPLILRVVFTKKEIDLFIEEAVIKLKKMLASGVTLTSYEDELYIGSKESDTVGKND